MIGSKSPQNGPRIPNAKMAKAFPRSFFCEGRPKVSQPPKYLSLNKSFFVFQFFVILNFVFPVVKHFYLKLYVLPL